MQQGVEPWMGERSLPLWLQKEWVGLNARSSSKARDAGLATRPLQHTLADVLRWELTREPRCARQAGLSRNDERDLLALLPGT